MRLMSAAVVTTLALCGASAVSAQSLAEAAAKEKARRKGNVTKVVTDQELRGAGRHLTSLDGGAPVGEPSPAPAAEGASAPEDGARTLSAEDQAREDARREANQKAWRQRLQQATAQVTALESEIQLLENSTADMSGNIYSPSRAQQAQRLEAAKGELETARRNLETVQDEGRRNSFTPGS
ncbi:MAG: hypothetical protein AB7O37_06700 [Vicinamibacteria bacterium]